MSENDSTPDLSDGEEIACTLTEEEAERRRERVADELFPHLEAVEEGDGEVTITFEGSEEAVETTMEFARLEHQCCSFATFDLQLTPGEESNRLTVSGEGTEAMYEQGLEPLLQEYDASLVEA